jgi:hypothetical protein
MKPLIKSLLGIGLVMAAQVLPAANLTDNLITDGGIEKWETVRPSGTPGSWWLHLKQHKDAAFTYDAEQNILMPKVFSQSAGLKGMQMETADVHGGKHALRLRNGIYLRSQPTPLADGDILVTRFWVKGTGMVQIYPHVSGDAQAMILETKGKPVADRWTVIEQRILIAGPKPETIGFRLVATEEALIDDIFLARVLRPGEIKLAVVADNLQERIAFAAEAGEGIAVDGKLDEPDWNRTVAFSGFRSHEEQTLLAPVQPSFRVLFDKDHLYFGIEIPLPDARQVLGELKKQPLLDAEGKPRPATDTFTGRESVELFLQAPGQSGYRQLVVSLDGYRYDGSGMDKEWNGAWEFAVSAADDRWFLEMKIPARDLGIGQIAPAEGWRLNLCCNQPGGVSTWAAVGSNYHNPFAFGALIARGFSRWHAEKLKTWTELRQTTAVEAGKLGLDFGERLERADAFGRGLPAIADGQTLNGDAVTRLYMQMNFVDAAWRGMNAELAHARFFMKNN